MDDTTALTTARLELEPLREEHASEMMAVLADHVLYQYTGGEPPTAEGLAARYQAQVAGSGSADEQWHNWIVRRADTGEAAGFVQATVEPDLTEVAWLIGVRHQGQGFAIEAAQAMVHWLKEQGSEHLSAHVHPGHGASGRVAGAIGFERSGQVDDEGEEIWVGR